MNQTDLDQVNQTVPAEHQVRTERSPAPGLTNSTGLRAVLLRLTRIRRDREAGRTLAELIFGILLISGGLAIVGTIALPGRWFFLGGIIVGAVTAVLLVINMYDSIEAAISMNEKRARNYASLHGALRIAVTAVLLGIAIWISVYSFAGLALGVASIKVSGLLHGAFAKLFSKLMGEKKTPEMISRDEII